MKVKGMIFAAGIGSRLRPITDTIPKALVDVGGMPMLQRTLIRMKEAGIDHVVVNVHHHAPKIIEFLVANNNFGMDISVSDESDELLDTGGGLLKAVPLIGDADAVVLHNADIFTDIPLLPLIERYEQNGADVVLAVNHRSTSRYLLCDDTKRMCGWMNVATGELKPDSLSAENASTLEKVGFCGIHIVRPQTVFPALQSYGTHQGAKFSLTPFYIENSNNLNISCVSVPSDCHWIDIGKPETLTLAREIAERRKES